MASAGGAVEQPPRLPVLVANAEDHCRPAQPDHVGAKALQHQFLDFGQHLVEVEDPRGRRDAQPLLAKILG